MRGKSGRVVIDMDPAFKRRLYAHLSEEGISLKEWFVARAVEYLERDEAVQLQLDGLASTAMGRSPGSSGK
jgi:hypothetical protein